MNDYKKLIDEVIQAYNLPKARVEAVLETCLRLGVEPIGNVFLRKAEDVEKMVELFNSKNLNINNYRTVFRKTYADVKEIFDICDENNIIIEPSLFRLYPEELKENVAFVKPFGIRYLKSHILTKKLANLQESMPLLKKMGVLKCASYESTILGLSKNEIIERTAMLLCLEKPMHKVQRYSQEDRFDKIFSLSKEGLEKYVIENSINERILKYKIQQLKMALKEPETEKE